MTSLNQCGTLKITVNCGTFFFSNETSFLCSSWDISGTDKHYFWLWVHICLVYCTMDVLLFHKVILLYIIIAHFVFIFKYNELLCQYMILMEFLRYMYILNNEIKLPSYYLKCYTVKYLMSKKLHRDLQECLMQVYLISLC